MEARSMTYGEKAVGLTFNPSGDPKVQKLKELYAAIIDICNEGRDGNYKWSKEYVRLCDEAVTHAQTAQMWAVKAVTWRD